MRSILRENDITRWYLISFKRIYCYNDCYIYSSQPNRFWAVTRDFLFMFFWKQCAKRNPFFSNKNREVKCLLNQYTRNIDMIQWDLYRLDFSHNCYTFVNEKQKQNKPKNLHTNLKIGGALRKVPAAAEENWGKPTETTKKPKWRTRTEWRHQRQIAQYRTEPKR